MQSNQNLQEMTLDVTLEGIGAAIASRDLLEFTQYCNPDYQASEFHKRLAAALAQFVDDVSAGLSPRMIIEAPPRHGKTELASRNLPAYALGKNPNWEFIGTSYSSDLALRNSRDVQKLMDGDAYGRVFPNTSLNPDNVRTISNKPKRTAEFFEVVNHKGAYRAAGVGGGITGMGADIGLIDDPVKDAQEASSPTYRSRVWEWYETTFATRISKGGGVLVIMTRWHEDDLVGRLLEIEGDKADGGVWQVERYPAIAEADEGWRGEGDALDPNRWPLDALKALPAYRNPSVWASLYQQRPSPDGGGLIKLEWLNYWTQLPDFTHRIITADTAMKAGDANDYSVFQCWGFSSNGAYLIDQIRGKWEYPDLEARGLAFFAKHKAGSGKLRGLHIEDKSSGTSLLQSYKRNSGLPIVPIKRSKKNKVERVNDVLGYITAGRVFIPKSADFTSDLLKEIEAFPAGANDDQIDPMADALDILFNSRPMIAPNVRSAAR